MRLTVPRVSYGRDVETNDNAPETFMVGAAVNPAGVPHGLATIHGGGTLWVEAARVGFRPGLSFRTLLGVDDLVHEGGAVTVTKVWWMPPWFNTFFVVGDARVRFRISTGSFARPRLRRALRMAGIHLKEERAWMPPAVPRLGARDESDTPCVPTSE